MRDHGSGLHQSGNLGLVFVIWVIHGFSLGTITQMIVDTLGHESLLEVELQDAVLAGVVPQERLLVLPLETALRVGTGVGSAVREDLVNPFLEMFHHQVVLLLSVLVLCFRLKSAQLTSVGCSEPISVLGKTLNVQHDRRFVRSLGSSRL